MKQRSEELRMADAALKINASLSLAQPITTVLRRITDVARELIGAHQAVTRIRVNDNWVHAVSLSDKYARWREYDEQPSDTGIYSLICRTNQPMRLNQPEVESHPAFRRFSAARSRHPPLRGWLAVPLIGGDGKNLGLLQLSDKYAGEFSAGDEAVAVQLAHMAVAVMENWWLYDKLREAERRKDEFLVMLGHELRNPLAIISTAIELLRRTTAADARPQELQDMIEGQVRHMGRLIEDLLDVARIARGNIALRKEQCDLAIIVCRTVEDYRAALAESQLNLRLEVLDQPLWVTADRTRLAQVVGNVLYNAIKFTESGGTVTVRLRRTHSGEASELAIRDTGIGMDAETLARIFEPFRQAEHSSQRSRGGLGLGLALVKGVVELHSGEVRAFSEGPERGSEVIITLPLERASVTPSVWIEPRVQSIRPYRILIIEDNRLAALCMQMFFIQSGHTVEVAHTGSAGIEVARQFRPDVVLCDIGLPDFDGYAVARALRQEIVLKEVCLIAISGYGQEEDQRQANEAGFDVHLTKPVELDHLQQILAKLNLKDFEAEAGG